MSFNDRQALEDNGGMTAIRELYGLAPGEVAVLFNLVKHWQPDKEGCRPTQERIARDTGLALPTVKRSIKSLGRKGLISYEKLPFMGKSGRVRAGKINHYNFHIDVSEAIVNGEQGNFSGPNRDQNDPYIGNKMIPNRDQNDPYIGNKMIPEKLEVENSTQNKEIEIAPSAAPDGAILENSDNQSQDQNLNGKVNGKTGARSETTAVPIKDEVPPQPPPVAVPPPSPQICATRSCDNVIIGGYTCDKCKGDAAAARDALQRRRERKAAQKRQERENRAAVFAAEKEHYLAAARGATQ